MRAAQLAFTITIAMAYQACSGDKPSSDSAGDPSTEDTDTAEDDSDTSSSGRADANSPRSNPALDAGKMGLDAGKTGQDAGGLAPPDGAQSEAAIQPRDGAIAADGSGPPAVTDFGAKGPFDDAKMFTDTGPNGTYIIYRPDTSLGRDGFKHPIGVWGNGIGTTPDQYQQLLTHVASHGFVLIACPDVIAEEPCLNDGLDWLVEQNSGSGPLAGKLDTASEFSIGFSWGGGAAIDVAKRPNIKTTVSMHGMPPRNDPWASMHAPLVLFSSTGDTIVPADQFVTANYDSSQVQTFFATLQNDMLGHMFALDPDSFSCSTGTTELLAIGPCTGAREEHAPVVAWLRYSIYGDQSARSYYYGDDCKLCSGDWSAQRKNWN